MARALALALPPKLEILAEALDLPAKKDMKGSHLTVTMSCPRRPRRGEDPKGVYYFDEPGKILARERYCDWDVVVETQLLDHDVLHPLSPKQQRIWELNEIISVDRGIPVLVPFAHSMRSVLLSGAKVLQNQLFIATGEQVKSGHGEAMKNWVIAQGYPIPNLDKTVRAQLLAREDLAPHVRKALVIQGAIKKNSARKILKLLNHIGVDGRVREWSRYHGAGTGRFTSVVIQMHNLDRPTLSPEQFKLAVELVETGDYNEVLKHFEQPLAILGELLRYLISASPGHVLMGADYSAIESCVLAWLANELWKIDAHARYHATRDPADDVYYLLGCRVLDVKVGAHITGNNDAYDDIRAVGKVLDLALGFSGAEGALYKFDKNNRLELTDEKAKEYVEAFRREHPNTVNLWNALDAAAIGAVKNRDEVQICGRIQFICEGQFLFMILPSGRRIAYPQPTLKINKYGRECVSFMDNAQKAWRSYKGGEGAWRGTWVENAVQGIARDLLCAAMFRLEKAGYPIVLHVHDELCAEVPVGFGNVEEFVRLMTKLPAWALGLPVSAKGWVRSHFTKGTELVTES
jgi:DNA polymerase